MGYAEGLSFSFFYKEEAYRVVERAGSARCHMSADSDFLYSKCCGTSGGRGLWNAKLISLRPLELILLISGQNEALY